MDEVLNRILDCLGPKHGAIKDLAQHLDVSPNVITNWKNGSSRSYRKYLKQISEHLGVSVDYLLGNEQKEEPQPEQIDLSDVELGFLGDYKELTEENKATVRDMVRLMRERQKEG